MTARGLALGTLLWLCVLAGASLCLSATALAAGPTPPAIEGESEAAIAQTSATLAGVVNPLSQTPTACEFQYVEEAVFNASGFSGTPPSLECAPSAAELGSGEGGVAVGASLAGLQANTIYYYRLLAANATGTSEGAPQSFLTLPNPPSVSTGTASAIGPDSATISGSVNPGSSGQSAAQKAQDDTTYQFQYSADTSYENQIPLTPADAGEGTSAKAEQVELSGLEPGTTYHYRIVASNDNVGKAQVVDGESRTFSTLATPPTLGPTSVGEVTETGVTVSGSVDAQGLPTRYELRLGSEPGELPAVAAGNTSAASSEALSLTVGSLNPGSVYYYELVALNPDSPVGAGGEREPSVSAEGSFATLAAPVPTESLLFAPVALLPVPPSVFASEASFTNTSSTPKKLTNGQKLAAALKACARKPKGKRAACRKQAHKRYGVKAKAKNSGKRG